MFYRSYLSNNREVVKIFLSNESSILIIIFDWFRYMCVFVGADPLNNIITIGAPKI